MKEQVKSINCYLAEGCFSVLGGPLVVVKETKTRGVINDLRYF